jgi:ABC-type tungstate transport system substrate-binding protein
MFKGLVTALVILWIVMVSSLTLMFAFDRERQRRRQIIGTIIGGTLGLIAGVAVGFEIYPIDSSLGPHGPALGAALFHGLVGGYIGLPSGGFAGWLLLSPNRK